MNIAKTVTLQMTAITLLATATATVVLGDEVTCFDAKICAAPKVAADLAFPGQPDEPPITVMHGTPLWGDISPAAPAPTASKKATPPLVAPKPHEVVATEKLDEPHNGLAGEELTAWNRFCRGQDPKAVYEWRYNKCNGLDASFVK